jgi:Cu/Ag efflux pump CusA
MTTVMLVAAMVPMAMGRGPGSGTRASMAKVILGGQALSLLLTLLLTPVAIRCSTVSAGCSRVCAVAPSRPSRRTGHNERRRGSCFRS